MKKAMVAVVERHLPECEAVATHVSFSYPKFDRLHSFSYEYL